MNWFRSAKPFLALLWCVSTSGYAVDNQQLDDLAERTLTEFQVPGLSLAVVKDGELAYTQGYGVAKHGGGRPVTENTLFQIGSVSKAFTAASLAILVDQGKVNWDSPVIDYLPEFRMHDAWVTREFTVRDLLTHRSGLPLGAGDLLLHPEGKTTVDEVIRAMRFLKPTSSFRSRYDYDNLMYIIAGAVIARVSGQDYEAFLEQQLLKPLGMEDCVASYSRVKKQSKLATPHILLDGELQYARTALSEAVAAAGGVTCSAKSMGRWLNFVLHQGLTEDAVQLISQEQFQQLLKPVTLMPTSAYLKEYAGATMSAYALGWNVSTFNGTQAWSHGGAIWGMTTFVMILPDQQLAVFVTNNQMSPAPRALGNAIAELYLSEKRATEPQDWIAIIQKVYSSQQSDGDDAVAKAEAERAKDSKPSLPLAQYTGRYRDPWYGDVEISTDSEGKLFFRSERNAPLNGQLEHFQYDTFIVRWSDRQLMADAYVSFSLSPSGEVAGIKMKAVSPNTDFSYDFHDLDLKPVE